MNGAWFEATHWSGIRLVVFDVDGTLYRQAPVRVAMARALAWHCLRTRDLTPAKVLGVYRRTREKLADAEAADFEPCLIAETARATSTAPERIEALVADWMEQRPLRHLKAHAYEGVHALFAGLRRSGRRIGILSDYPAAAKLTALGLQADAVVVANDPEVRRLKPNPSGLERLMARNDVGPADTLLIGDRIERDGAAGQRAGVRILIRADRPLPGWQTISSYNHPLFAPILARSG